MSGIALGPPVTLLLVIGAGIALVRLIGGRRRKPGLVIAAVLLLLLVTGLSLFFARAASSRAVAERSRAVAMRQAALEHEAMQQEARARADSHGRDQGLPDDEDSEDEDEAAAEYDTGPSASTVEQLQRTSNEAVAKLTDEIKSARDELVTSVQVTPHPPKPPKQPISIKINTIRPKIADRSPQAQIVTGILLAGVVLAGYFFLNANTRGHYTWRLRVGSTLVFAASLATVLLMCR